MCVIVYKKPGLSLPDKGMLAACFDSNPDGAGLLLRRPDAKQVEIHKGFMSFADFFNFASAAVTDADLAVYHFRIATSGGINPGACHPFPVSADAAVLKTLSCSARYGFAHNGIIGPGSPELSDTMLYIKDALAPRLASCPPLAPLRDTIAAETKGSRTVLVDGATGETLLTGEWIEDGGLLFSNGSYMPRAFWEPEDYYVKPCPECGADAEIISLRHALYECEFCGCLFDGKGDVWALGTDSPSL